MFARSFTMLLAVGLAVTGARAADSTTRIARLIQQLGSNLHGEREEASRQLDAIGEPALADLRKAQQSDDAEVRRRAESLARRIAKRVDDGKILTSPRVRLVYKDTPLSEALADFSQQAGFTLQLEGDGLAERRITLDTGVTTFWHAFDRFCGSAGLIEQTSSRGAAELANRRQRHIQRQLAMFRGPTGAVAPPPDNPLVLVEGTSTPMPACNESSIRVRALTPQSLHAIPSRSENEVVCTLEVTTPPNMALLRIIRARIDRASNDQGLSLEHLGSVVDEGESVDYDLGMEIPVLPVNQSRQVPIRLKEAAGHSRALACLQGTLGVEVRTAPQPLVSVDKILQAAGTSASFGAGGALKVLEVQPGDGVVKLHVRLEFPGAPQAAPGIVRLQLSPAFTQANLKLHDVQERALRLVSVGNARGNANDLELVYALHADRAAAAKLSYLSPRLAILDLPFTLKNVPLP